MKNVTYPVIICFALLAATGSSRQMPWLTEDYEKAITRGADAMVTLLIKDEQGDAVPNATVTVGSLPAKARTYKREKYLSGETGEVVVKAVSTEQIGAYIEKVGYYSTSFQFVAGDPPGLHDYGGETSKIYYDSLVKDGRWLPWNPTIPVVLREVRNPVPLYATWVDECLLPNDVDVGFDCEKGDFIKPLGRGVVADFTIRVSSVGIVFKNATSTILLSAVEDGGGFLRRRKIKSSAFISEYEAPIEGYDRTVQTPDDVQADEYLFFKSRIVRNEEGNIVSANYGKLYGEVEYGPGKNPDWKSGEPLKSVDYGWVRFSYYFNPTPNDRNLEFDKKKNLFGEKDHKTLSTIQTP
jgi:hypothetical protein